MINTYKNIRIEFHILQSFPVTCLNRDEVGAPKTAIVGGVTRARVSSQCWKRQVRLAMKDFGIKLATRTKYSANIFEKACLDAGADEASAKTCGKEIAEQLVLDTLLFISKTEAKAFAEYAKEQDFDGSNLKNKDLTKIAKKHLNPAIDALDIVLFGRMVAKAADMNIEAAASFAHAISTHKVSNEVEFFTALDDLQVEPGFAHAISTHKVSNEVAFFTPLDDSQVKPGSAHMGSLEFNSATYYRYVSLDLGQLAQVLGEVDLKKAITAFTKALFVAVPNARQTTQSGASAWDFARVLVRKGQRLQLSFEEPVKANGDGYLQPSIERLKSDLDKKKKLTGSLFGKIASYDWGEDENFSIDDLVTALQRSCELR